MENKITLQQISQATGVAVSTVSKALKGQKGIKKEKRQEIIETAEKMGYIKRSIKEDSKNVLAFFPSPEGEDKYFYQFVWKGVKAKAFETQGLGLKVIEETFDGTITNQKSVLKGLIHDNPNNIDGIVTIIWDENEFADILDECYEKGIEVFTVSSDAPYSRRIATVLSNPYRKGRLAAEYLGAVIQGSGKVIIAGTRRDIINHAQEVRGFINQMSISNPDIQIVELYESKEYPDKIWETLFDLLKSLPDVKGIYANNARMTKLLGKHILHSPYKDKLKIVGSEIFQESIEYMKKEVFCALIDQKPYEQGYKGIDLAYQYLVKKNNVSQINYVTSNLYLRNNLPDEHA